MILQKYRQLQAERSALEKLLAEIPADREIERIGLEARKQEIDEALAAQPTPSREMPFPEKLSTHLQIRPGESYLAYYMRIGTIQAGRHLISTVITTYAIKDTQNLCNHLRINRKNLYHHLKKLELSLEWLNTQFDAQRGTNGHK